MKELINYITAYSVESILMVVLIAVLIASFIILIYKTGNKSLIWKIALELVIMAEKEIVGDKQGNKRLALVMGSLYMKLPFLIRLLFSQKELEKYIEQALEWLKEQLKSQTFQLPTKAIENVSEAIIEDIIPVINEIPTNIIINQEPIQPAETVTPIEPAPETMPIVTPLPVSPQYDMCGTCQGKFDQKCSGCDGRSNYMTCV